MLRLTFRRYLAFVLVFLTIFGALGGFLWTRLGMQKFVTSAWLEPEAFQSAPVRWALGGFLLLVFLCFALLERLLWNKSYVFVRKHRKRSLASGLFVVLGCGFVTKRLADQLTSGITASHCPDAAQGTPEFTKFLYYQDAVVKNMKVLSADVLLLLLFLLVVAISLWNCWNESRSAAAPTSDGTQE